MKRYLPTYMLYMLAWLPFVSSCIRDEIPDCPPLRVNISVKDKNYFNVDKVDSEERRSEDLAFREYVPTLYWILRDAETGEIADKSQFMKLSGEEKTISANICPDTPHGKYVLTVWGGLENLEPLGEDPTTFEFHRDNTERRDVYMTNDTLLYDAWHNDYTVELKRTKGKLIIEKVNLPKEVSRSEKRIEGLSAIVNNEFKYSGETYVSKQTDITASQTVTKTILTPSVKKDGSLLSMKFYNGESYDNLPLTPDDVKITMNRNELTVLRYVWDNNKQKFNIYILINDSWDLLNSLTIE
ncbi:MAG: hypothetical protein NC548_40265 [Lachnospiraceae bacterium]|nr:hypothetical protein [Lachnospiraceae bacterium]